MAADEAALRQFLASYNENVKHNVSLTTDVSPGEVMEVCEQMLLEAGWKLVVITVTGGLVGGFVDVMNLGRTYCKEQTSTVLTVHIGDASGTTSIQLSTCPQTDPCTPEAKRMMAYDYFLFPVDPHHARARAEAIRMIAHSYFFYLSHIVVPSLPTPPKARLVLQRGGGSSGGLGVYSHNSMVTLDTEMAFADLVQAYEKQLSQQGWQELVENHGDESALSTWQLSKYDAVWIACFSIAPNPTPGGKYMLWLNVEGYGQDLLREIRRQVSQRQD